jgi:hypothetical protein
LISIFNEKKYAEDMMASGFQSTNIKFDLRVLGKYYYFEHSHTIESVKKILISFCEYWLPGFRIEMHYHLINSVIQHIKSANCKYIVLEGVYLSQEFVNYFNSLDVDMETKKILFTLGVWGKINDTLGYSKMYAYSYNDYRDLKKAANIETGGDILDKIHELSNLGYVRGCYTGAIELTFIKDIPEGIDIYKVTDFNNIGRWMEFYNGIKNYMTCENCKKIFKPKSTKETRRKYCVDCSKPKKIGSKLIQCETCGVFFVTSNKNNHQKNCKNCGKLTREN